MIGPGEAAVDAMRGLAQQFVNGEKEFRKGDERDRFTTLED